jgi:lysophospholipase L1-like esterase
MQPNERRSAHALSRAGLLALAMLAIAAAPPAAPNFVAAWTGSAQGPYPVGNPTAQPELKFALPSADRGASDQTFRLIVRPDIWGTQARIRLSNAFGTKPVTFDGAFVGLQVSGSTILHGTSRKVTFGGKTSVTVPPGKDVTSDPVMLAFVKNVDDPMLMGRKLAVSFHVVGDSGPITWHAKGLTTSYMNGPGGGAVGADEGEAKFPYSTTSWYFLDAVEMSAPAGTRAVVALGDSITDGTASTINGDDRWPDVFARRVHAAYGNRFAVVNEGIGGNMVIGPADYAKAPFSGGPSALDRLERDVISLPGVAAVVWLEGINDFGNANASTDDVIAGVREGVKRLRARIPDVRIVMATLTSSLNSTNGGYGAAAIEEKRSAYNKFIRTAGIFDGVVDFDGATFDPKTGELQAEFQPNSSTGGPGDKLHPNRAGYAAMGQAIDLKQVAGK